MSASLDLEEQRLQFLKSSRASDRSSISEVNFGNDEEEAHTSNLPVVEEQAPSLQSLAQPTTQRKKRENTLLKINPPSPSLRNLAERERKPISNTGHQVLTELSEISERSERSSTSSRGRGNQVANNNNLSRRNTGNSSAATDKHTNMSTSDEQPPISPLSVEEQMEQMNNEIKLSQLNNKSMFHSELRDHPDNDGPAIFEPNSSRSNGVMNYLKSYIRKEKRKKIRMWYKEHVYPFRKIIIAQICCVIYILVKVRVSISLLCEFVCLKCSLDDRYFI